MFYHVVKGEKVFYFAPPTPENLRLYEAWTLAGVTSEGPPPPPGAFFELIAPNERYMARIKAGTWSPARLSMRRACLVSLRVHMGPPGSQNEGAPARCRFQGNH